MIIDKHKNARKRSYCPSCHYVQQNCLCASITEQSCHMRVIILQHPTESKHSKNSAKLVKLCIKQCEIIIGEQPQDFANIRAIKSPVYVIYPSEQAVPIESLKAMHSIPLSLSQRDDSPILPEDNQQPITLVFIDASWRKAYKMWQQNPWLQQLPNLTFTDAPKTQYQIRKHKRQTSLSTLEAVAYCLNQIENADTKALFKAFDAMIAMHNRYRP